MAEVGTVTIHIQEETRDIRKKQLFQAVSEESLQRAINRLNDLRRAYHTYRDDELLLFQLAECIEVILG